MNFDETVSLGPFQCQLIEIANDQTIHQFYFDAQGLGNFKIEFGSWPDGPGIAGCITGDLFMTNSSGWATPTGTGEKAYLVVCSETMPVTYRIAFDGSGESTSGSN